MPSADLSVRRQRDGELAAVQAVTAAAFGPQDPVVPRLVEVLQASDAYAGLSFVAEIDGELVGHTMLTRGWIDAPDRLVEVQVLSPLSVAPEHQSRGVGRALVESALQEAWAAGSPAVFLEGDPGYYARLGFRAGGPLGFGRPSVRIPEPAFQVMLGPAYQPWITGRLIYSDRFWLLDCVGLR
jgi:putative acetyltransferase